jgi:hypothetical protein
MPLPDEIREAELPGSDALPLVQGGDFGPRIYGLSDPDSGDPIDLDGLTLAGWIGSSLGPDSVHLADLTVALSSTPADGTFSVSLPQAIIDAFPAPAGGEGRLGFWQLTVSDGTTTRVLIAGAVTLRGAPAAS